MNIEAVVKKLDEMQRKDTANIPDYDQLREILLADDSQQKIEELEKRLGDHLSHYTKTMAEMQGRVELVEQQIKILKNSSHNHSDKMQDIAYPFSPDWLLKKDAPAVEHSIWCGLPNGKTNGCTCKPEAKFVFGNQKCPNCGLCIVAGVDHKCPEAKPITSYKPSTPTEGQGIEYGLSDILTDHKLCNTEKYIQIMHLLRSHILPEDKVADDKNLTRIIRQRA